MAEMDGSLQRLKSARVVVNTECGSSKGFIVDTDRGIIVTYSYVLDCTVCEVVLVDKEEIRVFPIYGDPVYDFGFLGYNPDRVEYLVLEEIPIDLCIKTLSEAEHEEEWARTCFLPVERVNRALAYIQNYKDLSGNGWEPVNIPRGTLQASFVFKSFDDTLKLGLKWETQQLVKHASPAGETGMLVVDSVAHDSTVCEESKPGNSLLKVNGEAQDATAREELKPGDFLLKVNGEVITRLFKLETVLDDHVDHSIEVMIEREGKLKTLNLLVIWLPGNVVGHVSSPPSPPSTFCSGSPQSESGGGLKCHLCGEKSDVFASFYALTSHINKKQHNGKKQKKGQKN